MAKRSVFTHLTDPQARTMLTALDRAKDYAGGWSYLAAKISTHTGENVSAQAVFRWAVSGVPAERAVDIEHALDGLVLRQELRPDLYEDMLSPVA